MKQSMIRSWSVVVLVVVVVAMCMSRINGAVSPSQCEEEKRLAVKECKAVVFGQQPSAACCQRVRVTHYECVCPVVTPKLAALVTVNRAISVMKRCGRTVPRHFKCGSKIGNLLPPYVSNICVNGC